MASASPPADKFHLLLFVLLSAFMVLAGTHLLETVCHSIGLTQAKPISSSSKVGEDRADPNPGTLLVTRIFRWLVAVSGLFLAYNCLALREWARRLLVYLLCLDLGLWLVRTVFFNLLIRHIDFVAEKLAVQVLVVFLEGGLLWTLTHPSTQGHFATNAKERRILPT